MNYAKIVEERLLESFNSKICYICNEGMRLDGFGTLNCDKCDMKIDFISTKDMTRSYNDRNIDIGELHFDLRLDFFGDKWLFDIFYADKIIEISQDNPLFLMYLDTNDILKEKLEKIILLL